MGKINSEVAGANIETNKQGSRVTLPDGTVLENKALKAERLEATGQMPKVRRQRRKWHFQNGANSFLTTEQNTDEGFQQENNIA